MDPRLLQALRLLQECARDPDLADADDPAVRLMQEDWLQSSTDILAPWYPQPPRMEARQWRALPEIPDAAWDEYFGAVPAPLSGSPREAGERAPEGRSPFDAAENVSIDWATEAAVSEALYGFVHALGREDVTAALTWVAADYHAMDGDREVTRDALRLQLEALIDARRGRDLQVTLTRVPELVAHPLGVLVNMVVQVDSRRLDGSPESLLFHRVAVFVLAPTRECRLISLGMVDTSP